MPLCMHDIDYGIPNQDNLFSGMFAVLLTLHRKTCPRRADFYANSISDPSEHSLRLVDVF